MEAEFRVGTFEEAVDGGYEERLEDNGRTFGVEQSQEKSECKKIMIYNC